MNQKKDAVEMVIQDELKKEAKEIQKEYEASGARKMPENLKADIRENLQKEIQSYELENLYARLPEQDQKALELGRKLMAQEDEKAHTVRYRKKRWRIYGSMAAVLVLALAIGVTSFGGAERIIAIMKSVVGDREVVQIDSDEDNMIIAEENEEEAYQKVKDVFGVEPVRMYGYPEDMNFESAEIDESLQTAEFLYKYNSENVAYIISVAYADISWGIDVEDEVTEQYYLEKKGQKIEIKGYKTPDTHTQRYSARFSYYGMEYFLVATMNKPEFEKIVEKLYFFD